MILQLSGLAVGKYNVSVSEPGNWTQLMVQSRLSKDWIMAAALEGDANPIVLDRYRPSGLDEAAVKMLGRGLLVTPEPRCEPAVTAVGDHGQCHIEVDVKPHLARQAVEMKEVHADAQS